MRLLASMPVAVFFAGTLVTTVAQANEAASLDQFRGKVQPILETYCYGCHGYGSSEGGRTLDEFASDDALFADKSLWWAVLKNVRSRMMPPADQEQPSQQERDALFHWIVTGALGLNPADPDPGRATLRRLNRVEYRNTIRDLMGIDYNTEENFPPDDTGYGFDNIGDALSLSPLLMEKYIQAAEQIVASCVPQVSKVAPVRYLSGGEIKSDHGEICAEKLSFYDPVKVTGALRIDHAGEYRLTLEARIDGDWQFDPGRCQITYALNGKLWFKEQYSWHDHLAVQRKLVRHFEPGEYALTLDLEPLTPADQKVHSLDYRVDVIRLEGPLEEAFRVLPKDYPRFFPGGPPPAAGPARDAYAREVLSRFASLAFRRPADEAVVDRLVGLAKRVYEAPGKSFEQGVSVAMIAVLTSPRFLFRMEEPAEIPVGKTHPQIDEYSLAARLSYFLWSTTPDEELLDFARRNELRAHLESQLTRMFTDPRSNAFVSNFTGQWLQSRDLEIVNIDALAALGNQQEWESLYDKFHAARRQLRRQRQRAEQKQPEASGNQASNDPLREQLARDDERSEAEFALLRQEFERIEAIRNHFNTDIFRLMRAETEMTFDYVVREDRDLIELIDADYTFVNEQLAKHYGIVGVSGSEMRRVELPPESPRGGILTQGTMLVVTSNPTRTSPVKRGLFVLDNILGTPAPPPPGTVPPLEAAVAAVADHPASLREALERHRSDPLCAGCHARMDPLGFALENFNALGMWRDTEHGRPLDTAGTLLTGESFENIRDLKKVLQTEHRVDFYRCFTEKLLTYAIGRGLEYYDEPTVDALVRQLDAENGRFSVLLRGVVQSAAFQQHRAGGDGREGGPPAEESAARESALDR